MPQRTALSSVTLSVDSAIGDELVTISVVDDVTQQRFSCVLPRVALPAVREFLGHVISSHPLDFPTLTLKHFR